MRPAIWQIRLAAWLLGFAPTLVAAQSPGNLSQAPTGGSQVALVDIVKVFEHHTRFKQQMEAIKSEITAFERELNRQRESIAAKSERLGNSSEGERRQIEADVTRQLADLKMRAQLKRNEILEREAALYYQTYNEVTVEVSRMAANYGISLVLRYDSSTMNPQQRDTVLKGVNRAIVFHRNLDLTDHLIRSVSSRTSQNSNLPAGAPRLSERSVGTRIPFTMNLSR